MKGSYILLIKLKNDKTISIGKLGKIQFGKSHLFYGPLEKIKSSIEKLQMQTLKTNFTL